MPGHEKAELAGGLRTVIHRLAFHLRAPAAERGLTPSRLAVLVLLSKRGPTRPGDLAATVGIRPASMSRLVESLEEEQWVARSPDADDRRAHLLELTPRGRRTLHALRTEGTTWLSEEIATLSGQELHALEAALPVLEKLADRRLDRS